ncbi:hypothetical protein [Roseibium sp.]|uniref:hypothetical protein n=1 Tax=Roseibium sp. TaxID=1936156 RepID=UPI003BAC2281
MTAPAGRGKTALLVRWIDQLKTDLHLVFVPISIRYQTNLESTFYNALGARLAEIVGEELPQPRSDPAVYYREKTIEYLGRIEKEKIPCLIVIDGLDEARGWSIDTTILPSSPADNLRIVISARELAGHKGSADWLSVLGWTPPHSCGASFRVDPLSLQGVADVLDKMRFPLARLSQNVDVIEELYRLTEQGDPLLLTLYVNDLLADREGVEKLKPEDLAQREPGFGAYFRDWINQQRKEWQAMGTPINEELIDTLFAVLATAEGPLRLADIEALVNIIAPNNRYFSTRILEPISRFIIGEGGKQGYALAHPKLSEYLRKEYFEDTKILKSTSNAFLRWMSSILSELNKNLLDPSDTPPYALLYFSQHLKQLPVGDALPHFRSLLEGGWRNAWIEYEDGGTLGFTRDIDLSAQAFRGATKDDRTGLRVPRIGLGARVRSALILSTLRSIGKGIPNELLAEFIRLKSLTPVQALHFAQLKNDNDRGEAIAAIIQHLPDELRREAHAAAREIANPAWRAKALMSIVASLSIQGRKDALQDILDLLPKIEDQFVPDRIILELDDWATKEPWIKGSLQELKLLVTRKSRRETEKSNSQSTGSTKSPTNSSFSEARYDILALLTGRLHVDQMSKRRLRNIIEELPNSHEVEVREIIELVGEKLDEELISKVFSFLDSSPKFIFSGKIVATLSRFLTDDDELLQKFAYLIKKSPIDIEEGLSEIIPRLSDSAFLTVLEKIKQIDDDHDRGKVILVAGERLPLNQFIRLLIQDTKIFPSYKLSSKIHELSHNLNSDEVMGILDYVLENNNNATVRVEIALGLIRSIKDKEFYLVLDMIKKIDDKLIVAKFMEELAPSIPFDALESCIEVIHDTSNPEARGKVVAAVLPRFHDAKDTKFVDQAYEASLLIGDSINRALCQLALATKTVGSMTEPAIRVAFDTLESNVSLTAETRPLYVLAALEGAGIVKGNKRVDLLASALAAIRTVTDESQPFLLALYSMEFEGELRSKHLTEAVALAQNKGARDSFLELASVAFFHTDKEFLSILALAERSIEKHVNHDEQKIAKKFIEIFRGLFSGDAGPKLRTDIADLVQEMEGTSNQATKDAWSHILPLMFAKRLPQEEVDVLQQAGLDAIENLQSDEEYQERLLASAAIAPYLEGDQLAKCIEIWLDAAQQAPRNLVLFSLAVMDGIFANIIRHRPNLAGNLLKGSPLTRLGGSAAVEETLEAIADVSSWYP